MIFIFLYVYNINIQIGIKKEMQGYIQTSPGYKANADTKINSKRLVYCKNLFIPFLAYCSR